MQLAKGRKREEPLVQGHAAHPEWVLDALVGAGDKPIERYGDLEPHRGHASLLFRP
jgi:hypothetical protein